MFLLLSFITYCLAEIPTYNYPSYHVTISFIIIKNINMRYEKT